MKKFLVLTFISAAISSAPALAADMPVNAPIAALAPTYSWTACYIGGNVGYAWKHVDPRVTGSTEEIEKKSFSGWAGGGQIGCDYQISDKWVVGVQGLWDAAGVR